MGVNKRVWIDTDAGVDDAQAIMMAIAHPDVDVMGITTVHGNASVTQVTRNVMRLLNVVDRLDIPVYRGCDKSLLGSQGNASHYHGLDGFGDVPDPDAPDDSLVKAEHAVTALLNMANQYEGEIELICLAPLTNVAMAIRLDPDFGRKLKTCYIMGGNYEAKGNVSMAAEFNFHTDPEAAHVVLGELHAPITMACWELCLKHSLPWTWYKDTFSVTPTPKARLVRAIETKAMQSYYANNAQDVVEYETADQFASAIAISPDVVMESTKLYCTVELTGTHTRGQMICDWGGRNKQEPNVTVVTKVDLALYQKLLLLAGC